MRRRNIYLLILLAQMGFLGVGWCVHVSYQAAAVRQAAREKAWSELEGGTNELLAELGKLPRIDATAGTAEFERVTGLLKAGCPHRGCALIVDPQWRVVVRGSNVGQADTERLRPGERASWTPVTASSGDATGPLRGMLAMPDGVHFALAYALKDQRGYVLFHRPVAEIEATCSALVRSLPVIGVTTFAWTCVLLCLATYLLLARFFAGVERKRTRSAGETLRQAQDLVRTRDAVIFGLAKLTDSRDPETGNHLERISAYSTVLASALRRHPKFRNQVTPGFVRLIGISSALHDIGKVGIEDSILRKPGPLTAAERARVEAHCTIGGECLREIERRLGSSNFLQMAREIAFAHHERWDGTGYPRGLAGEAISLAARIVAVADTYDALSSKRVYKAPLPHEECVAIMTREAGIRFEPEVMEVWVSVESKFRDIARHYANPVPPAPGEVDSKTGPETEREETRKAECLVSSAVDRW